MNLIPIVTDQAIDEAIYDELGERWYTASDNPIALLRAESKLRNPWIMNQVRKYVEGGSGDLPRSILDVGCGAGFLTNGLAKGFAESIIKYQITGIDISEESLKVARLYDSSHSVSYRTMNAHELQFENETFDVVCAMDFLEHTSEPGRVILEIARVLKPGGLFFFHTFNRNWLSRLIVIKGVEWFVKNTPRNLHVYELFLKPSEVQEMCLRSSSHLNRQTGLQPGSRGLKIEELLGVRPRFFSKAFWQMILTRTVPDCFEFVFTQSTLIAYTGMARKY